MKSGVFYRPQWFLTIFRLLRRDWRSGDLLIVLFSILFAVACFTTITAFTSRLQLMIEKRGSEILAADLVIRDHERPKNDWLDKARELKLKTATASQFRSVAISHRSTALVSVKAVSINYPLRGHLLVTRNSQINSASGPGIGQAYIDKSLLSRLQLKVGERVEIGDLSLKIIATIDREPDRSAVFANLAPRLMMHEADIERSGILTAGSIVSHRLLVAGEVQAVEQFRRWLTREYPNQDIRDLKNASPRVTNAIARAENYLSLAAVLGIMLAGVSISRAIAHYCRRQRLNVALLRCFGASNQNIISLFLIQITIVAVIGSIAGVLAGYSIQGSLSFAIGNIESQNLPPASLQPALAGLGIGIGSVLTFSVPFVMSLKKVPAIDILRLEAAPLSPRRVAIYCTAMLLFLGLLLLLANDLQLLLYVCGISALTLTIFGTLGYWLIRLLQRRPIFEIHAWRLAIANLGEDNRSGTGDRIAIAIALMAILLLTVVKDNLLAQWSTRLDPNTPNHFFINIDRSQIDAINQHLGQNGIAAVAFQPMVRARLRAINGEDLDSRDYGGSFAKRRLQRASNLTWRSQLAQDNRIVTGKHWVMEDHGKPLLSVEQRYAESLGLKLGDSMTFDFAGEKIEFRIINTRQVNWDSFQPNFFLVTPPGILDQFTSTYVGSLFVAVDNTNIISSLIRQFPNITDIDITAVIEQVIRIIESLSFALQFIFLFVLIVTLIVVFSTIYTARLRRIKQLALLRVFGASTGQLHRVMILEFLLHGLVAGIMASLGAFLVQSYLSTQIFKLSFSLDFNLWLLGPVTGTLLVLIFGLASFFSTTRVNPQKLLTAQ